MLEQQQSVHTEMIVSALDWWVDAGVDVLVEDEPRVWLAANDVAALPIKVALSIPAKAAPIAMPDDLPAFVDWLMQTEALSEAGPAANRVRPAGNPAADIMVIIDMPDVGDTTLGSLISDDAGEMFDKMIAATIQIDGVERSRETIYLASLLPGRTPGGSIDEATLAEALPILRHHIALVRPKKLWLMGQAVSRTLLGADAAPSQTHLQNFNHDGRNMISIVTHPPRFLLQQPKWKKGAWDNIQTLIKGTIA